MQRWRGARSGDSSPQAYFTSPPLAEKVARIAKGYEGPYIELGVGDGALYSRLPRPRQGVELCTTPRLRFASVRYGCDALGWTPRLSARCTVVMNPPFAQQVEFFNHAATFAHTIVWIAGANVRLWTTEDKLAASMHLECEYMVPDALSAFDAVGRGRQHTTSRTTVQVWRRKQSPRRMWNLVATLRTCPDQTHPPQGHTSCAAWGRRRP